jgi:hypothetical protein
MAIFADMAEFDHDRRFKRFVVHHGRNAKQPIWLQKWPGTCAQKSRLVSRRAFWVMFRRTQ